METIGDQVRCRNSRGGATRLGFRCTPQAVDAVRSNWKVGLCLKAGFNPCWSLSRLGSGRKYSLSPGRPQGCMLCPGPFLALCFLSSVGWVVSLSDQPDLRPSLGTGWPQIETIHKPESPAPAVTLGNDDGELTALCWKWLISGLLWGSLSFDYGHFISFPYSPQVVIVVHPGRSALYGETCCTMQEYCTFSSWKLAMLRLNPRPHACQAIATLSQIPTLHSLLLLHSIPLRF